MSNIIPILVVLALLVFFPAILFIMLVRAIHIPGTRWWGIVVLLSLLTCYCTTVAAIVGLIVGGNATGSAALERRYCEEFREALTQTDTLPEAIARVEAAAATDEYQIREPDKNLRFRYVWLLGGCFLFAGANFMMFAPGRRERRHPTDCIVMIVAALVVFLTGVWQIAWGNGYAAEASSYHHTLTWISAKWHEDTPLGTPAPSSADELPISNARIAAWLSGDPPKRIHELFGQIRDLCAEPERMSRLLPELPEPDEETGKPDEETGKPDEAAPADARTGPGIAIIGGADGPTAVFISSEILKKQGGATAGNEEKTDSPANEAETEDNAAD